MLKKYQILGLLCGTLWIVMAAAIHEPILNPLFDRPLLPTHQLNFSKISHAQHQAIDSIDIHGRVDVDITYGRQTTVTIEQGSETARNVYAGINGRQLVICAGLHCASDAFCDFCVKKFARTHKLPKVMVKLPRLHDISYAGKGDLNIHDFSTEQLTVSLQNTGHTNIRGHNINLTDLLVYNHSGDVLVDDVASQNLALTIYDKSKVRVRGVANLTHLEYGGTGMLDLHWVSSCHLDVFGHGSAQAYLAGVVGDLHVYLSNHAYLDARYLRTKNSYVNTNDFSRVDVYPLQSLGAYARGFSNIYYYHTPLVLSPYMRENGSVLSMHDLQHRCDLTVPLYKARTCQPLPKLV